MRWWKALSSRYCLFAYVVNLWFALNISTIQVLKLQTIDKFPSMLKTQHENHNFLVEIYMRICGVCLTAITNLRMSEMLVLIRLCLLNSQSPIEDDVIASYTQSTKKNKRKETEANSIQSIECFCCLKYFLLRLNNVSETSFLCNIMQWGSIERQTIIPTQKILLESIWICAEQSNGNIVLEKLSALMRRILAKKAELVNYENAATLLSSNTCWSEWFSGLDVRMVKVGIKFSPQHLLASLPTPQTSNLPV